MNKCMFIGRLTRDPEVRYTSSAEPLCVSKFTLAVNRRYKREGEADADFFNCVAMGKSGEFVEKYKKGQQVAIVGRLQIRTYDKDGQRQWITEIMVEEQYFADSKQGGQGGYNSPQADSPADPLNYYTQNPPKQGSQKPADAEPFFTIDEPIDDSGLPF